MTKKNINFILMKNLNKEYLDFVGYTSICFISDINKIFKSCKI